MRLTGRFLATCSAAAMAALCTVAVGVADAQAARPQGQEARPARAAAPQAIPPRAGTPKPGTRLQAAQVSAQKQRVQGRPVLKAATNPKAAKARLAAASAVNVSHWGGISCVPFARAATGMSVKGNAHAWWDSAAGSYERGFRPEAGSILTFRSTQRMRLGHVAVVARVIDSRTVEVDHANWAGPGGQGKGRVARSVPVIDVSERNDWSAVQVGLPGGGFGSVYPTYGFIYDRPDRGMMVANNLARPRGGQGAPRFSEVADAWSTRVLPAGSTSFAVDAPQRTLR
jgi:surface antigen